MLYNKFRLVFVSIYMDEFRAVCTRVAMIRVVIFLDIKIKAIQLVNSQKPPITPQGFLRYVTSYHIPWIEF